MTEDNFRNSRQYLEWWQRVRSNWDKVAVKHVEPSTKQLKVGEELTVRAVVNLATLKPEEVRVQLYYGRLDTKGLIQDGSAVDMTPVGSRDDGTYEFTGTVAYNASGERGISVRVLPFHEYLDGLFQSGLVRWAVE